MATENFYEKQKTIFRQSNVKEKNVNENKTFWIAVRPFLSDKIVSKEQIISVENNEIFSKDSFF